MKSMYERIRRVIYYYPETGNFTWLWKDKRKDRKVKFIHDSLNGYPDIRLFGKLYHAQDIAYLCMFEELPKEPVTSINGNKYDLRWDNLSYYISDDDSEKTQMMKELFGNLTEKQLEELSSTTK